MKRKMTVVFHDEDLYTTLKVEAARRHMPASDIIADAVREWLERREDAELLPVIEAARAEWKEKWKEKGGQIKTSEMAASASNSADVSENSAVFPKDAKNSESLF